MTTDPIRGLSFAELREELDTLPASPVDGSATADDDAQVERREVLQAELSRRDDAPIPMASSDLDDAPTDPGRPTNPARPRSTDAVTRPDGRAAAPTGSPKHH